MNPLGDREGGHSDVEELLGAYALDAVDDDERRLVEGYLATNPRARAEVQQHREVATMLAFTGAPAPPGLWDRIAASIEGQPPQPGPELARVLPMAPRRRRSLWVLAGGIAAAPAAVIGLLAAGYVDRGRQIDDLQTATATIDRVFEEALKDPAVRVLDLRSADGSVGARAAIKPDGTGFLAAQDLPELQGQDYQLWGVIGDNVISLGVLGSRPEVSTFTVAGDLKALAITKERPGGVEKTDQTPELQGELN